MDYADKVVVTVSVVCFVAYLVLDFLKGGAV